VEKFDRKFKNQTSGGGESTVVEDIGDVVAFARERLGFEPDEKQEMVLRGGRRGIVNCTRQWGKSTVTACKAVHRAYSAAGSLTLVVTPSGRQSGEFLRKAEEFVRRLGIKVRGDGDNEISIAFPNGSRIVGLPGNEATARGYSASLLLIDEAARVDDQLYRAMRPSLAVANGDLWLMSTPYGKRGFFWEEWEHGGSEWERISVPATECPRISAQLLAEECAKGDETYRREYLCEFGDIEGAVFSRESIDAALQDFPALEL
jgi:Terminase large subunit, T4likevirus-type, N-terminal